MGWLADILNEPLKEIVEQGYHRDWLPTTSQSVAPEITAAKFDSGQMLTMNVAGQSGGEVQQGEDKKDKDDQAGSLEGAPDPTGTDVVTEADDADADAVAAAAAAAAAAQKDDTVGGTVVKDEVPGSEEGSPEQQQDGSSGVDTTVKKRKPNSAAANGSSTSADPDLNNGGGKHRLPRTSQRHKLFPNQSKSDDTTTGAKVGEAGAGEKGETGTGDTDE